MATTTTSGDAAHVAIPMSVLQGVAPVSISQDPAAAGSKPLLLPGPVSDAMTATTAAVSLALDARRAGPAGTIPSLSSPMSRLAKLQSYLPTGTWITYTALQTWALSINPNTPPPTADNPAHQGTCNSDQRIALSVAIALGLISSFGTPFIKSFVVDADGKRILFPPPSSVKVSSTITDRVSHATFPYQQKNGKWLWPVADRKDGGWVRENGMVKVMEFRLGCDIRVRSKFLQEDIEKSAVDLVSQAALGSGRDPLDMGIEIPTPELWWKWTLRGPNYQYLDFSFQVWMHALVSVLAFAALALFSTQVSKCLYPKIPDYLPGIAQTTVLAIVSFVGAYLVNDQSVSFGQATYSPHVHNIPTEDLVDVPQELRPVVERVFFVQGRPNLDIEEKDGSFDGTEK